MTACKAYSKVTHIKQQIYFQKVKICQQTKLRRPPWSIYINLWLRYNDFWFGKTNVYHIGILLQIPISTIFT